MVCVRAQLYDSRVTELESALEKAESKRGEEVAALENELQAARQVGPTGRGRQARGMTVGGRRAGGVAKGIACPQA